LDVAQAVESIKPSIVQISFTALDISEDMRSRLGRSFFTQPIGTGFLVDTEGHIITARHVIQEGNKLVERISATRKQLNIGFSQENSENMRGNFVLVDFDIVDEDNRHDLILLKLRSNPFKGEVHSMFMIDNKEWPLLFGMVTLNPNRPKDGVAIGVSGYPLNQTVLVTNAGWLATSWGYEQEILPVPNWFYEPNIADFYLADIQANPGNSGGPVYLIENATVIGVCVGILRTNAWDQDGNIVTINHKEVYYSSGLTKVIPVRYLIELLVRHNVNWK